MTPKLSTLNSLEGLLRILLCRSCVCRNRHTN